MDTLGALSAALPAVEAAHALLVALAEMERASGSARVAYAAVAGSVPDGASRALARYVRTSHARRAGVHAIVLQPRAVRFATPHPTLPRRRVCVRATEFSAEVAGHVDADVHELGRALDGAMRAAGASGAFAAGSVRCCQVYWYTGVRTDLDRLEALGSWELAARGAPARLRTASRMLSACVYANGTVSIVARCVAHLARASVELLAALRRARAPESADFGRIEWKDEARRPDGEAEAVGDGPDDDDGDFAVRRGAGPPVARTARRRRPRGGYELREERGRGRGDLCGGERALPRG
jgi:hypothetical protein